MNPDHSVGGTFRNGQVVLDGPQPWPDGIHVRVAPVYNVPEAGLSTENVIIVGFGLAGRCVADLLDNARIQYTIVEKNAITVETQRALGKQVVSGDGADAESLIEAGLNTAAALALTIPDEAAVLKATTVARRLRPDLYIIARTNYASQGMRASQLGANEVIKAEQAVAVQFYDRISAWLYRRKSCAPAAAGLQDG